MPSLLRRVLWDKLNRFEISVKRPKVTHGKPNLIKHYERFIDYAALEGCDGIVVVVDADDECPKDLATGLASRAIRHGLRIPLVVVCPNPDFEIWFVGSLAEDYGQSIRDRLQLPESVKGPEDLESVRKAKSWLNEHMPNHHAYKPTVHQNDLTHHIRLDLVYVQSRSFRRLCNAIKELIDAVDEGRDLVSPLPT